MEFIAKYTGDEADNHLLPAYNGAVSMQGIARSLILVTHYLHTGKVRYRAPYADSFQVYIRPPRAGSVEALFDVLAQPANLTVGGTIAVTVTADKISDLVGYVCKKVAGLATNNESDFVTLLKEYVRGDVDALCDAVEPAMEQAHRVIGYGASNIDLIQNQRKLVRFDSTTRDYVTSAEIADYTETMDASVGSLNVNAGTGRVFFHDLGKTVPFKISKEPDAGTYEALSRSIGRYATGAPSDISITFYRIESSDDRTKKIVITGAREIDLLA